MIALSAPADYAGSYGSIIADADSDCRSGIRAKSGRQRTDFSFAAALVRPRSGPGQERHSTRQAGRCDRLRGKRLGPEGRQNELPLVKACAPPRCRAKDLSSIPSNGGLSYSYKDEGGATHQVRLLDGATFVNQLNTAEQIKPAGIALLELGSEDQFDLAIFFLAKQRSHRRLSVPREPGLQQ